MSSQINVRPYLYFGGHCEAAMAFYQEAVGAKVDMMMRFSESPEPLPPEMVPAGFENKIMHATFRVGDAIILASDGCEKDSPINGFCLALTVAVEAEAQQLFDSLSAGGTVTMPPAKTFWSPFYGLLTDRFGVDWMVMVA